MKILCKFKDPDTMTDCVDAAYKREARRAPAGVSDEEWSGICEARAETARDWIAELWMEYSEYITVEFDTETKTARVVPRSEDSR